jgi:hypothetical protein
MTASRQKDAAACRFLTDQVPTPALLGHQRGYTRFSGLTGPVRGTLRCLTGTIRLTGPAGHARPAASAITGV